MILEAFLLSLNCVVILLILGGAGYVTAARGWYDKSSRVLLARLVTSSRASCRRLTTTDS